MSRSGGWRPSAVAALSTHRSRRATLRGLCAAAVVGPLVGGGDALAATQRFGEVGYRFGVFPYLPALSIDRIFGPVALSLCHAIDYPLSLKTKPTFEKFFEELARGHYDIAFLHPMFYVAAHDRFGYQPLARVDAALQAVLLVDAGSKAQTLEDLAGRVIALPPRLAAVSEMMEAELRARGLQPGRDVELRHFRNKASCLQAVAIGSAAACGVPKFITHQIQRARYMNLRTMFESRPLPHFAFVTHERVPEEHNAAMRQTIVNWPNTAEGRDILASGAWGRFVEAHDADYDPVRRLRERHLSQKM